MTPPYVSLNAVNPAALHRLRNSFSLIRLACVIGGKRSALRGNAMDANALDANALDANILDANIVDANAVDVRGRELSGCPRALRNLSHLKGRSA